MPETAASLAAASGGSKAAAGAAGAMDPISGAVQAAAMIAQTVAGINDQDQRRKFEFNLAMLNHDEQLQLARDLNAANTTTQRMSILVSTLGNMKVKAVETNQKRQTITLIVLATAGVVLFGTMVWAYK